MTLRKVRVLCNTLVSDERGVTTVATDADGDHVLLTVEEYRERITDAYREGCLSTRTLVVGWPISATKRRLDEEVGDE